MMMALAALVCLAARAAADAPKGPTLRVRLGSGALRRVALDAGASVRDVRARTNCEALFGDAACAGEALSDDADVADLGLNGATLYAPLTKKAPEAARAFRPYPNRLAPSGKRRRAAPRLSTLADVDGDYDVIHAAGDEARRATELSLDASVLNNVFDDVARVATLYGRGGGGAATALVACFGDEEEAVAKLLGFEAVGCVVAYEGPARSNLTNTEVLAAANAQCRAMQQAAAVPFVFVVVAVGREASTRETSVEAFELSEVCVALVADGLLKPSGGLGAPSGGLGAFHAARQFKVDRDVTDTVDVSWLYRPLPILQAASRLRCGGAAAASLFGEQKAAPTAADVADFALLKTLRKQLNARDFAVLCAAVGDYVEAGTAAALAPSLVSVLKAKLRPDA